MQESLNNIPQNSPLAELPAKSPWIPRLLYKLSFSSPLRASVCSVVNIIFGLPARGSVYQFVLPLVFLLALLPVAAQDATTDETILIDLTINHGMAYREGAWAPVDVFVNNTERDIEGFVEVSTFDFSNERQSPTYRLPAVSPKGSRKHFRLYCKLQGANRIEVQLYHGNRAAVPVPSWLNLTPIERKDYLGLILDDNHHDYGFLSSNGVIGKVDTRFHREGLTTEKLGFLADHLPCYTNFDLIVMGDIDPEAIAPEHRALLQQYVELGGTLAINLGQNANRYKGSWLEPLMGVSIGENAFTAEADLATRAFSGTATGPREGMVTALSPASDSVRPIGNNFAAGALNTLGTGRVATFTVDALSGLLQNDPNFLQEWNHLLAASIVDRPLNLPAVVDAATQRMPAIAGVRLLPISSVIAYLLLYFFVAIVGNWLFWNKMKRREMAWVCLVFFSLAFTSYAMIFGTQGRARSTQLEQLEVLELSANTPHATLHGITGLLAKGSGRFGGSLTHPQTLVSDAASSMNRMYNNPGMFGSQGQSPFQFVQGEPGTIKNVSVGASEMRFLQSQAPLELTGALVTDLVEADGKLSGTIQNNTGLPLKSAMLVYNGQGMALKLLDTATTPIDINLKEYASSNFAALQLPPGEAMTVPDGVEFQERGQFANFLSELPQWLLSGGGASPPPCLVAWVGAPPMGSIDLGTRAQPHLGATLAVTWLEVKQGQSRDVVEATVALSSPQLDDYAYYAMQQYGEGYVSRPAFAPGTPMNDEDWKSKARSIQWGETWPLDLTLPTWMRTVDGYTLQIDVVTDNATYSGPHEGMNPRRGRGGQDHTRCTPRSALNRPPIALTLSDRASKVTTLPPPSAAATALEDNVEMTTTTYMLPDWKDWLLPRTAKIEFQGELTDSTGQNRNDFNQNDEHYHVYVGARLINSTPQTVGE